MICSFKHFKEKIDEVEVPQYFHSISLPQKHQDCKFTLTWNPLIGFLYDPKVTSPNISKHKLYPAVCKHQPQTAESIFNKNENLIENDNLNFNHKIRKPMLVKNKSKICKHGNHRYYCKECKHEGLPYGGTGICKHNQARYTCKKCSGSGICKHGINKHYCVKCKMQGIGGNKICEHNKSQYRCKICSDGRYICKHGSYSYTCKECDINKLVDSWIN